MVMKTHRHLLKHLVSGFLMALLLSLAYLCFGSWETLITSPKPLWAKILFLPGVAAGHLCWNYCSHSEVVCKVVGLGVMGVVGGIIGLVLGMAMLRRQSRRVRQ